MLGAYGAGILGRGLTYAEWYSLWLHKDRMAILRAAEVAHGIALALGGKPDKSFFDAVCNSPEEAAEALAQARATESERATMARYGVRE